MAKTTLTPACLAVLALTAAPAAERVRVGDLGEPQFADRETSATFALPAASGRNWRLTLSLEGTPSNRVEVAFGRDADTNGVLGAEEIVAVAGWDRGVWAVSGGGGLGERHTAEPSGDTLTLDVRFPASGGASPSLRDGGGPLSFAGLPAAPAWLDPRLWDTARLTARGAGVRAEDASVVSFPDGTSVRLK